jgi:hypothetical protein
MQTLEQQMSFHIRCHRDARNKLRRELLRRAEEYDGIRSS